MTKNRIHNLRLEVLYPPTPGCHFDELVNKQLNKIYCKNLKLKRPDKIQGLVTKFSLSILGGNLVSKKCMVSGET